MKRLKIKLIISWYTKLMTLTTEEWMELSITLASEKNQLVFHVIQKMLTELFPSPKSI